MGSDDFRAIGHDLPCENCRYNLRGLTASDRCPECGEAVSTTLAEVRRRQEIREERMSFLRTADSTWLEKLREGAAWGALGLVTKCVAVLLPGSIYTWKSPTRVIPLSMLAAAWVLEWVACWKLGTPDPREITSRRYLRAWSVRILATIAFAGPFLGEYLRDSPPYLAAFVVIVAIIVDLAVSWLVYWNLRHVAKSLSSYFGMLVIALCCFSPFCLILGLMPELDAPEDTLWGMVHTSSILSGSPEVLTWVRGGIHLPVLEWIELLFMALVLIFEIQLFYRLNYFRKNRAVLAVTE